MDLLLQAISVVGFPIVAFLLMYRMTETTIKDNSKAIRELTLYMKAKQ